MIFRSSCSQNMVLKYTGLRLSYSYVSFLSGCELRGRFVILDKSEKGSDQWIARRGAGGVGKVGSGMSATLLIRSSGSRRGGWVLGGGRFGGDVGAGAGAGTGAGTGADAAFAAFCLSTANFSNATNFCAASAALSAVDLVTA